MRCEVGRHLGRSITGVASLGVLTILAFVACEYPGIAHPLAAEAAAAPPTQASPTPAVAAGSAEPAAQTAVPVEGPVDVALQDFRLVPNALTAKAGAVTFALSNKGRYTHDFRVQGEAVDDRAPKVGSGRALQWSVTLKPGEYRISCPVSNHADRGMTGTLTVVE